MGLSLKNKILSSTLFATLLLLVNCGHQKETETDRAAVVKDSVNCAKAPLNPNGDSELALLMRDMMKNSDSLRTLVMNGKLPKKFPEAFLKIHTAKPTDSDTKKASFTAYADNYVSNLQLLYNSPEKDLHANYNALINACASCHSEHCPGPLRAINKLKLN